MEPCNLSVVIPAYNEGPRIESAIMATAQYLAMLPLSWELIVVNDGSRDDTQAGAERAARALAPQVAGLAAHHIQVLQHPRNLGKGAAVRTGVLASAGQFILFCDADGATPMEELAKFLPALQQGADVVAGSRRIAGAQVRRHQPRFREFAGCLYTWLANLVLGTQVSDFTCGFKALRRPAAQAIFSRMCVNRWSFDAELFFLARRLGFRTVEVAVTWADQPQTKVRMVRDAVTSFAELLVIRGRAFAGAYR